MMISNSYFRQRQLAEIIETIHLANLIHKGLVSADDLEVINGSQADMEFGNKIAVLSGDFLLANACMNLAKLENEKVRTCSRSAGRILVFRK